MAKKDIIGPGFIGSDTIKFIITRGFGSSAKGWAMESLMVFLVAGGARRLNPADAPGLGSSVRGWAFESMIVSVLASGARRFNPADSPGASSNKGWAFESLQAMISRGGRRKK